MPDYDAFISYSHREDRERAAALHRALHRFAKPWYRLRAVRVYHDTTNLSADPGLWSAIERALRQSRYLILMGSPTAAASEWVPREVAFWKENRPPGTLMIVVTAGELVWGSGDFDWERTTALPRSVTGMFSEEPRWVDLRDTKKPEQLSVRHAPFREAVVSIASVLRGMDKDALDGEDVREFRRTRRLSIAAVLTLLATTTIALAMFFNARLQRDRAESRALSARAEIAMDEPPPHALELAVAAARSAPTLDAERALRMALARPHVLRSFGGADDAVRAAALSPDGRLMATAGERLVVWDVESGEERWSLPIEGGSLVRFTPDGQRIVCAASEGLSVSETATGRRIEGPIETRTVHRVAPSGRHFAVQDEMHWEVWSTEGAGQIFRTRSPGDDVSLDPRGELILVSTEDGHYELHRPETSEPIWRVSGIPAFATARFSSDGAFFAGAHDGGATVWSRTGEELGRVASEEAPVVAVSADGRVLATATGGTLDLWRTGEWGPKASFTMAMRDRGRAVLRQDGRLIATIEDDGVLQLVFTETGALAYRLRTAGGGGGSLAFGPDGSTLVLAGGGRGQLLGLPDVRDDTLHAYVGPKAEVAFSADGRRILTTGGIDVGLGSSGVFAKGRVWNADNLALQSPLDVPAMHGMIGPRGERVLLWTARRGPGVLALELWRVDTSELMVELVKASPEGKPGHQTPAAFSADGRRIYALDARGRLRVWDMDGRPIQDEWLPDVVARDFSMSSDGKLVALSDHTARRFDLNARRELLPALEDVESGKLSPDGTLVTGRRLVPTEGDETLPPHGGPPSVPAIWDAVTGQLRPTAFDENSSLTLVETPAGPRFVHYDIEHGRSHLLDVEGKVLFSTPLDDAIVTVLDSDGRRVVSSGTDGVRIWNTEAGSPYATIDSTWSRVSVDPRARRMLVWDDARVRVHRVRFDDLLDLAESRLPGRSLEVYLPLGHLQDTAR